jgi:tetratricopeptide (TPR) repeat protein
LQLYGRDSELQQLTAAFAAATSGQPHFVWLAGEPGSGKTRLLQEFYASLRAQYDGQHGEPYWPDVQAAGITADRLQPLVPVRKQPPQLPYMWWGLRCTAGSEHSPDSLQAYVDGIAGLERHLIGIEFARQQKKAGIAFAEGMLEWLASWDPTAKGIHAGVKLLKKLYDDMTLAQTGASELRAVATRTEDVFLRLFAAMNANPKPETPAVPLVVLLDDAQWLDARSVAFTRRLLLQAQTNGWKVLLVLSVRDTELAAQASDPNAARLPVATLQELRSSFVRIAGSSALTEVALPPELEPPAAIGLLGEAIGSNGLPVTEPTTQRLHARAGGQPFYLLNYVQHALENGWIDSAGELTCADEQLTAVPQDIGELLRQRLHGLPKQQFEILQWGSVQGRRFMAELIQRVATELGRNPAQAVLELAHARDDHHLLDRASNLESGLYGFSHRLLYEQINAETSPELAAVVSHCLLDVLAGHFDNGKLETLPAEERREALRVLAGVESPAPDARLRSARACGILCAEYDAVQDFRSAEHWARLLWQRTQSMLAQGLELVPPLPAHLARAYEVLKVRCDWETCLAMEQGLLELARAQGDEQSAAAALRNIGRIHEATSEFERALEYYMQALELARKSAAEGIAAKTLGQVAGIHHYRSEHARALELYEESLRELRRLGDAENTSKTVNNMALVYESLGRHAEALSLYSEVLELKLAEGDELGAAQTRNNMGNVCFAQGDFDGALEHYQFSLDVLTRLGDELGCAGAQGNVGAARAGLGDHAAAITLFEQSLAGFTALGAEHGAALTLSDLAASHKALGNLDAARDAWRRSAALYRQCGMAAEAERSEAALAATQ